MHPRFFAAAWLFLLPSLPCAVAGHPGKSVVALSVTADVGVGNEVFVNGSHPDLSSSGRMPHGVKLAWSPGNVWQGNVAIESGATVLYQFVKHAGDNAGFCSGSSVALGTMQTLAVPGADGPPYVAKYIRYVSTWTKAFLLYRDLSSGGAWTETAMTVAGTGRVAGEKVFEVQQIAAPGNEIEFVFHSETGQYDNAPAPPVDPPQGTAPAVPVPYQSLTSPYNYRTTLDVFQVQDGQIFSYQPPAIVGAPRFESRFVNSTAAGIPGRNIRIQLPRGYDNNTWKRYPVVYFHDGQNVFFPGGTFGTWDADRIARYETSQGRMREAILVTVDNGNAYGSDRRKEYLPPTDALTGVTGIADKYSEFLRNNVLPTLNYNYRTLNEPGQPARPQDTVAVGSSLGGLVTAYLGRESSGVFGRLGIFSPALWAAPVYVNGSLASVSKLPLQIYMDIGSAENSASMTDSAVYWNDAFALYNQFLRDGYAVNTELLFHPECGANHNEAAWSRRLPGFFHYALSSWDDTQWLAATLAIPSLRVQSVSTGGDSATMRLLAPRGVPFILESSTNMQTWSPWASPPAATRLWENTAVSGTHVPGESRFWRAKFTIPE